MKLATYIHQGQQQVGLVSRDGLSVQSFLLTSQECGAGVLALVDRKVNRSVFPEISASSVPLDQVKLLAPIPRPRRNIFCVGRNYHAHAKELSATVFKDNNADPNAWPIVFTKVPECVTGPYEHVVLPTAVSEQIDYEAELLVVIGVQGKNISQAQAMSYVYGYSIVNDVTARDVQMRHQQWDLGKSFDTFCPMGPWVVTADEFDGLNAHVKCWVNGELRQDGNSANMIFDIPTLIETCSRGITLYPGDMIATGTPAGVGMGLKPPQYLKHGDKVRIEIAQLGFIENTFVARPEESPSP
jgi:2-keto-4-pentenoate hydratase/2-oxohepta-3-ene-1,7-dioic acid hydratase in catechol pathway